jgi:nicotinamidase-related amidase
MDVNKKDTAVLLIDVQNDFLSEQGVTWELVGDSIKENNTVENIERLFAAAKDNGFEVFISPHYYYPTDHGWKFGGTIEKIMHDIKMFDRNGALSLEGFSGSGAKVYGPENNDVVLQLRKRGINKVILGGMSANLCVEAHLRELLEQGFEVTVVKDATAGARHPELGDGYQAALINYGYMANAVLTTDETVKAMEG